MTPPHTPAPHRRWGHRQVTSPTMSPGERQERLALSPRVGARPPNTNKRGVIQKGDQPPAGSANDAALPG